MGRRTASSEFVWTFGGLILLALVAMGAAWAYATILTG